MKCKELENRVYENLIPNCVNKSNQRKHSMRVELNEFSSSYFNANSVAQQIHSRIELKNKPSNKNKEEKSFSNNLYSRFQEAKKNKDLKK